MNITGYPQFSEIQARAEVHCFGKYYGFFLWGEPFTEYWNGISESEYEEMCDFRTNACLQMGYDPEMFEIGDENMSQYFDCTRAVAENRLKENGYLSVFLDKNTRKPFLAYQCYTKSTGNWGESPIEVIENSKKDYTQSFASSKRGTGGQSEVRQKGRVEFLFGEEIISLNWNSTHGVLGKWSSTGRDISKIKIKF